VTRISDKITSDEKLMEVIEEFLTRFHQKINPSIDGKDIMKSTLGYSITRASSKLPGAGDGVLLCAGHAKRGDIIALYPGTVYRRFEPVFLPSIGNPFVLRCLDGLHIDGNNRMLSKVIFKSCVGRDSEFPLRAADVTWLTKNPLLPWNVGQLVNNGNGVYSPNVAYQEVDLYNFPHSVSYLLPNIWYSGPQERHIRVVALVALCDIYSGDEILSNYYTLVHV